MASPRLRYGDRLLRCTKCHRMSSGSLISGGTPLERVPEGRLGARNPGSGGSIVWGTVVANPLNVVDGKLLAPPRGTALYYIANREKGF